MQGNNNSGKGQAGQSAILDATDTYCPDLFLVMRQFVKSQLGVNRFVQINTKESRAEARIMQICTAYGYEYKMRKEGDIYSFMLDLAPATSE